MSKYCSIGKVKGYIGPLDEAAHVKEALARTAHEREIIIFGDTRVHISAQAVARYRAAGWAHVLAVMAQPAQCQQLQAAFLPGLATEGPISCGTYATTDERGKDYPAGFKYFARGVGMTAWWRKWLTAGRAVALGYNVMAVDTDVVVLDDWYFRVKQPPLSGFNMLSQCEFGLGFNGGFSYIQDASQTGPIAWILYEAMHRAARWSENDTMLAAASPLYKERRNLDVDDQMLIRDCVFSAVAGRPVFLSMIHLFGRDNEAFAAMGLNKGQMEEAINKRVNAAWQERQSYAVPVELASNVCEHFGESSCRTHAADGSVVISTVKLQMPHSGGQWPAEFCGYPFDPVPGNYTSAFRAAYTDLGVPLPPDPEDPATEAAARATQPETFGYLGVERHEEGCAGCWAEAGWWTTGRTGWWHRHLLGGGQRKIAIGHIHAGLFPGDYQKELVLMFSGNYDWQVAAKVARSRRRLYFANQGYPLGEPRYKVPVVRAVVAFAPGVVHAAMSKAEFVLAAQGLAQVAVALGGIAAWPAAPCDADWALAPEARGTVSRPLKHSIPWTYLNTFFQVQPFGDSLEQLQCEWPVFSAVDCITSVNENVRVGRGMLAVEFHHLINTTRAEPGANTTLLLEDASSTSLPPPGNKVPQRVAYEDLMRLNTHALHTRLAHEQMPVFWLDRLVEVTGMAGEAGETYGSWRQRCMALRYLDIPERERERERW